MPDDQGNIPEHLQTTYAMVDCAFPGGITPDAYLPLLAVLCEEMSFREAAATMALFLGGDYVLYLNDVYAAGSDQAPSQHEVQRIKALLLPCGYQAWLDESI
ncbi:MAG: DUF3349 domain-containing protein [Chloroflexi bacterium]|nr:DUF3349 domain-containing protein [Chloroflexota bacterium]